MIEVLSDDILLIIFRHYLDAHPQSWVGLAHVCQSWRQAIFTSTLGLRLRLYCTYGTPVLKALDCWPPLPLIVEYGGFFTFPPPNLEDEDNIMAALEHSGRVSSISLTVSSSLLKKLSSISEPLLELEELVLSSQHNMQSTLPSTFWWGHRLRTLHSTGIAFPTLPQLLLPSQNLVDLQLHEIPRVGYFSPEAFANALCGMTRLQTLSLHFLSLPPRRNYIDLPPSPVDRVVLPALTCFKYRGTSKYLDSLVARFDAPRLGDTDITLFSQPTLDASQLGLFVNRIETWGLPPRADILSSGGAISISITSAHTEVLTRFILKIPCEQLDWQLSSISQICGHLSSFLSSVEDLGIKTTETSGVQDDMDDEPWLRLVRAFDGAKNFRVAGKLATDTLRILRQVDEGHRTVLPALQNLLVQEPTATHGPMRDTVVSFFVQRGLSGQLDPPLPQPTDREVTSAKRWVEEQKRTAFNRSFEGVVSYPLIPDSEILGYIRNLERLDMVLGRIEWYIHIAFASLRQEDVVRRMFTMMVSTKLQLEESRKLNPRRVLEVHTIQGMTLEAYNMDRGLRAVLGLVSARHPNPPNSFPHGLTFQQAQHRPPQQQQLSTQPTLTGIRIPEGARAWQQMKQQQKQQQQQQQFIQILRSQVAQGILTREQAQERLNMLRTSAAHAFQEQNVAQQIPSGFTGGMAGSSAQQQLAALSQRPQAPASNPMTSLQQRVIQAQDPLHARQLNMNIPAAQGLQQQNDFVSKVGQNLHPSGMGLPQGQGSLQQNFIESSPSTPPANIQSSAALSASQPTPQSHNLQKNFVEMPVQQLANVYSQFIRQGRISMSALSTQGGTNSISSSSMLSAGAVPVRRPTTEEVTSAKRWVEEQKRTAFNRSFEGLADYPPVPGSEIQEYIQNLERLDVVLCNIESYIHIAFAALKKDDVVRRMFTMMASTKLQLEESKKPNPRYVLELSTIRGMIQEADNIDKSLRTVLGPELAAQGDAPVPQRPQDPPPKSREGGAAAKPKAPIFRGVSARANGLTMASSAPTVSSTRTTSTPVDTQGGVKRVREDEADGATPQPGVAPAPSPKRVKSVREGPQGVRKNPPRKCRLNK